MILHLISNLHLIFLFCRWQMYLTALKTEKSEFVSHEKVIWLFICISFLITGTKKLHYMVNETINSMWFDCLLTHSNLEKVNIAQAAQTLSIFCL